MWGAWLILSLFSLGYALPFWSKDHRSFTKNIVGLGFFEGWFFLYPWNPENVRWQWKKPTIWKCISYFRECFFFQIKIPSKPYIQAQQPLTFFASGDHGGAPSPEWSIWRRGGAEALRWCLCGQKWAPGAMAAEVGWSEITLFEKWQESEPNPHLDVPGS